MARDNNLIATDLRSPATPSAPSGGESLPRLGGAVDPVVAGKEPRRAFNASPADALASAPTAATRHLRRHDVLYRFGDEANELFVVRTGTIGLVNRSADGREGLAALLRPGDLFGVCSLFDGGRRATDAKALETSRVVVVPYTSVRGALDQRPHLMWGLVRVMSERVRALDEALADSVFLDVTGRTAKRLLALAGPTDEFQLPVTQEELAALVGASRERVNKALSTFLRLGWLEQRDRRYVIRDRAQLAKRAGGQ
jgi:CRP/FNR family cyclic AMP-dependent transcriptional regulator